VAGRPRRNRARHSTLGRTDLTITVRSCDVRLRLGMAGLTIETTLDADLLAAVHAETVNFAYTSFFQPDSTPPSVEQHRLTWIDRLSDPTATAFVARSEGEPLGTVLIRADPDFEGEGQIVGLHVLPTSWGRGIGAALHDHALLALHQGGHRKAGLWVIDQNARARAMYDSRGWMLVPGVVLHIYGITEVRYRRALAGRNELEGPLRPTNSRFAMTGPGMCAGRPEDSCT